MFKVIDKQTQQVMGTYATRNRARNKADKLDMEYGAYRYYVKEVK